MKEGEGLHFRGKYVDELRTMRKRGGKGEGLKGLGREECGRKNRRIMAIKKQPHCRSWNEKETVCSRKSDVPSSKGKWGVRKRIQTQQKGRGR